ncbi:sugar phosphate isomerase/epimerase family protein [Chelativorans sp. YIM 93263]|uniref:sugar phosphate isomerase/epimerase family protein n=1 Tax=Chelativorans sp. YIM 93263 TaxID=2906648 RepID=UPI002378B784|nr:TIM barrel protein [Chelativorans sp. YIM 93263]
MTGKKVLGSGLNLTSLANCDMTALDRMLAAYAQIGCSHVEVSARRLDMIAGGRIIEQRVEAVAEILSHYEMTPVLHANHVINFMDRPNHAMHWAVAEASVKLAERMKMPSIVIHSGHAPADVWLASRKTLIEQEREDLKRLSDLAGIAGTQLALENLIADPKGKKVCSGADPRAVAEQIVAVDHPALGGCLDFGHAFLSAPVLGFDFLAAVADFSEQVWHLHLHDNCGIPDTGAVGDSGDRVAMGVGDLHMPMGWGRILWEEVLPSMRLRQGTYAMIELQGRYRGVEAMVADTAQRFADYWNGDIDLETALGGDARKEAAE